MSVTDGEIRAVEESLGIKLFDWQKAFARAALDGKPLIIGGRRSGRTLALKAARMIEEHRKEPK